MRLALIVEYEGTDYHGFQYQVNAPSIQEELEKAVRSLTGESVRIMCAGRTDAGVHAVGQVTAFDTSSRHRAATFVGALNFYLPDAIAVRAAYGVSVTFDPRRDALSRTYRYTVLSSGARAPLLRRTAHHTAATLDDEAMRRSAGLLVGTHDFARFAGPLEVPGASTLRDLRRADIMRNGDMVTFEFEGSSFLPHQVRRMVGALVDVGRGRLIQEDVRSMLNGGATEAVAHKLPANGLCLLRVNYSDFPPVGDGG